MLTIILRALSYLVIIAPDMGCFLCVGCPCPPMDFIRAKSNFLNLILPLSLSVNTVFLIFCILLNVTLKHRYSILISNVKSGELKKIK
jgi:hypothetical protein